MSRIDPAPEPDTEKPLSQIPTGEFQNIIVSLDGWEIQIPAEHLGDLDKAKKKLKLLYATLKEYDPLATVGGHNDQNLYIFRFSLIGESDEVLKAIAKILDIATSIDPKFETVHGEAEGILDYGKGHRKIIEVEFPEDKKVELDQAINLIMKSVYDELNEKDKLQVSELSASYAYQGLKLKDAGDALMPESYVPGDNTSADYYPFPDAYVSDRNKMLWEAEDIEILDKAEKLLDLLPDTKDIQAFKKAFRDLLDSLL
jgi:hypothetical protein